MEKPTALPTGSSHLTERELLVTLFDLGRQVTAVLDLDELLHKIPTLIKRITQFEAFAVYLLDEKHGDLRIAYALGYPEEWQQLRLQVGQGLVGAAVLEERPIVVNDVSTDPRYIETVPGSKSELVVPLMRKGRIIGALNVLSVELGQFTDDETAMMRQFGAHVAIAIENASLFEKQRTYADTLETLAEIGREMTSILELDQVLTRIAQLVKGVIAYRTFGIFLLDEASEELELKVAIQFGERSTVPRIRKGEGLVGYSALHKEAVLVGDVHQDPRYINVVEDVRSELVIPLLYKDRCIGVFDLESPERDAFSKEHIGILTLLASQAAIAIENARLVQTIRSNEERLEKEVRFAQRVQVALLPTALPQRLKGVDVGARFAPAREVGGDLYDFLLPDAHTLVVAVGDVSGKGVPAALYSAFAGELVRSRTFRRRYTTERTSPSGVLATMNTILHEKQLEEYYCTLCYASFDFKQRKVVLANSGLPFPVLCTKDRCVQIETPGVPLGSFPDITYEEVTLPLNQGDVFVFCSDGVFEAMDWKNNEFTAERLLPVIQQHRQRTAREIVDAIFEAVALFREDAPPNDDMTAVAIKVTS